MARPDHRRIGRAGRTLGPIGTTRWPIDEERRVVRQGRIDYRMQRRAALRDVRAGLRSPADARDAHPDLVRAGIHIGSPSRDACPLCDDDTLKLVTYVFDRRDARGRGGRAVPRDSLARQLERYGDLTVYTVEVCTACHWHHLLESFLLVHRDTAVG